ncbi:hypothetical protein [Lactiplantibacillus mudanjiangensis]|uniref:Uncharacterized protein n=1 Tax=Lactiplantibacillus mudanjiangensis TaxID=1296538 RepID=A0A660E2T9_9LACO|nr:hypothetical protein [Lactiplantibacillus mudanjiangensis]VDG25069.1 hypothetical protein MUDAN_IGPPGNFN_03050 [Lactiplantibacillus mudanjiangensis]VDG29656.1 hypothetical protein MUDAN_MDHGFNIF_01192 [Lactiplantibacillus mudanjiangensis]VDG33675.1 hypothetical protein MUDAN_DOGOELCO_02816 [Lactiplantibacillus mudanjiangensis]
MKNLILATLLVASILVMAYVDYQTIQGATYPTLAQESQNQ